jgi:hypothetical protein
VLNLSGTTISDAGIAKLAPLTELRELDISDTRITGAGLRAFPKLERIKAWDTRITDANVAALAGMRLTSLDLAKTAITDRALEALAANSSLRMLHLDGTKVTAAGVEQFRQRNPACTVDWK